MRKLRKSFNNFLNILVFYPHFLKNERAATTYAVVSFFLCFAVCVSSITTFSIYLAYSDFELLVVVAAVLMSVYVAYQILRSCFYEHFCATYCKVLIGDIIATNLDVIKITYDKTSHTTVVEAGLDQVGLRFHARFGGIRPSLGLNKAAKALQHDKIDSISEDETDTTNVLTIRFIHSLI